MGDYKLLWPAGERLKDSTFCNNETKLLACDSYLEGAFASVLPRFVELPLVNLQRAFASHPGWIASTVLLLVVLKIQGLHKNIP